MEWAVNAEFSMNRGLHEGEKLVKESKSDVCPRCSGGGRYQVAVSRTRTDHVKNQVWERSGFFGDGAYEARDEWESVEIP